MKKPLKTIEFEEMKNKTFEVVQIIEKLCELCGKPLSERKEKKMKTIKISNYNDYNNLFIRAKAHDNVEVSLEEKRIYLYDHDYPGDVHPNCIEKL